MLTVFTFGDSILDCAHYNEARVDPAGLLVANRDDLFPEFRGRDLTTRLGGDVRLERRAVDGSRVGDLPRQARGLRVDGPALAILTVGGNDLLGGLIDDDGTGIPAFARKLAAFLDVLPIPPRIVLGTVYDPTFGDDDAAGDVFPDPIRAPRPTSIRSTPRSSRWPRNTASSPTSTRISSKAGPTGTLTSLSRAIAVPRRSGGASSERSRRRACWPPDLGLDPVAVPRSGVRPGSSAHDDRNVLRRAETWLIPSSVGSGRAMADPGGAGDPDFRGGLVSPRASRRPPAATALRPSGRARRGVERITIAACRSRRRAVGDVPGPRRLRRRAARAFRDPRRPGEVRSLGMNQFREVVPDPRERSTRPSSAAARSSPSACSWIARRGASATPSSTS